MTSNSPDSLDSPDQTRATCEPTAEQHPLDAHPASSTVETNVPAKKAPVAAFSFPFSPSVFAPSQSDDPSWHQKGNQSAHHKTPSRTPNGSRRSMGKR
jgi:hypothetical protein